MVERFIEPADFKAFLACHGSIFRVSVGEAETADLKSSKLRSAGQEADIPDERLFRHDDGRCRFLWFGVPARDV
jgi:hypothetical protein